MKIKKIWSALLVCMMIVCAMSVTAFAENATLGTSYISTDKTYDLAETDTLTVTGQVKVQNGATLTINGGNISVSNFTSSWVFYAGGGNIIFNDVNFTATSLYKYLLTADYGSSITFNNSTITLNGAESLFYNDVNSGILNLNNTKVYLPENCQRVANGTNAIVNLSNGSLIDADGLTNHGFRNVDITIEDSTIDINGCETGIKNTDGSCITVTGNSAISVAGATDASPITLSGSSVMYATSSAAITVDGVAYENVTLLASPVAQIGDTKYTSLSEALSDAKDGDTITLISGDTPISAAGSVYGKNITITGSAVFDWSKGWLFVGRGGEGDATLTFENATIKAVESSLSNSAYGIHVSAAEKDSTTKYNGTVIFKNSDVQLSYLANRNNVTVDGGKLYVHNGFWVGGRPASETPDGLDGKATMDVKNGAVVEVKSHNGMGIGHESTGTLNIENGATFNYTGSSFEITAKGELNNKGTVNGNLNVNGKLISSGNVNGTITKASDTAVIEISGGSYTQNVNEWCADGFVAIRNLNGNYIVGKEPTATVNNLGTMTISKDDYMILSGSAPTEDMELSFVMQFIADQDAEDMKTTPYADWFADFVITFTGIENGSFVADGCYLAGYYGDFGWIKVPVDTMVVEEGARYPVMLGYGAGQKYDYICESVKDFRCAMYLTPEILEANPNLKVNLELSVVDNSNGEDAALSALVAGEEGTFYKTGSTEYVASDFEIEQTDIFGGTFAIINMESSKEGLYQISVYSGIDSLKYKEVGFEIHPELLGYAITTTTNKVYTSITVPALDGSTSQVVGLDKVGNAYRMFGTNVFLPEDYDNSTIYYRAYAIDLSGNPIYGNWYEIDDIYTLSSEEVSE